MLPLTTDWNHLVEDRNDNNSDRYEGQPQKQDNVYKLHLHKYSVSEWGCHIECRLFQGQLIWYQRLLVHSPFIIVLNAAAFSEGLKLCAIKRKDKSSFHTHVDQVLIVTTHLAGQSFVPFSLVEYPHLRFVRQFSLLEQEESSSPCLMVYRCSPRGTCHVHISTNTNGMQHYTVPMALTGVQDHEAFLNHHLNPRDNTNTERESLHRISLRFNEKYTVFFWTSRDCRTEVDSHCMIMQSRLTAFSHKDQSVQ